MTVCPSGRTWEWCQQRTGYGDAMKQKYRRTSATWDGQRQGDLAPLHLAIPELAAPAAAIAPRIAPQHDFRLAPGLPILAKVHGKGLEPLRLAAAEPKAGLASEDSRGIEKTSLSTIRVGRIGVFTPAWGNRGKSGFPGTGEDQVEAALARALDRASEAGRFESSHNSPGSSKPVDWRISRTSSRSPTADGASRRVVMTSERHECERRLNPVIQQANHSRRVHGRNLCVWCRGGRQTDGGAEQHPCGVRVPSAELSKDGVLYRSDAPSGIWPSMRSARRACGTSACESRLERRVSLDKHAKVVLARRSVRTDSLEQPARVLRAPDSKRRCPGKIRVECCDARRAPSVLCTHEDAPRRRAKRGDFAPGQSESVLEPFIVSWRKGAGENPRRGRIARHRTT